MKDFKYIWVIGLIVTLLIVVVPIALFVSREADAAADPYASLPQRVPHVDHTDLLPGPYETGSDVTRACLDCHEDAAHEVTQTVHWTWESEPVLLDGRDQPLTIGKKNAINNFCIGIQGNWTGCTRCHAGYGWEDAAFDFSNQENVDCLVCHEQTGTYAKSNAGYPASEVDLASVAQSVATPTRTNCGSCHFNGGGGNAVKHGDLDGSLFFPTENVDVHMGRVGLQCVDCHQTEDHQIQGHLISVSATDHSELACTNCHQGTVHSDQRITSHLDAVACQTCHIPEGAVRQPTKMIWDWSTAGQDLPEDPHVYLKIKGSFVYEENFMPEYAWFNGEADRYILGDEIDPSTTTVLNPPQGNIGDPQAKIWPFKVHLARQPYDPNYNILLQPKTVGEGGYWSEFDWELAARLGAEAAGIPYSGEVDFAETSMYWVLSHMVVPSEEALQCYACHGEDGRMDWEALGYYGDPMRWGGRSQTVGLNN
ncbi:MAG: tetrathionate reductase family octaheme c-type cytochrome [Candidatus Promineifilaceae bacterium]|nr:tetrathionate reductase family octaheme c-type cytochrome [Candidatus Promineifilaceae bacterium]